MRPWVKILLFEAWFIIGLPLLAIFCAVVPGSLESGTAARLFGHCLFFFLMFFWLWQWYVYAHYRHCRQEEFLFLVQTAAATHAPLEQVLRAYLNDRPQEHLFRGILLFFVFPGYYWVHVNRSFDARLSRLMRMLENGLPLDEALLLVPGIASRETMLAAAIGQYSGKLEQAMRRLPDDRATPVWLDVAPRMLYPLLVLAIMSGNLMFIMIFIIPKLERIFLEFKMKLPYITEVVIEVSRWFVKYPYVIALASLFGFGLFNAWLFSSQLRWHVPLLGRLYRTKVRGEFLQMLGILLETGKPLTSVLETMLGSHLLPGVVQTRVHRLLTEVSQGQPLPDALVRNELISAPAQGLIASAEKARNLPWALQELGDALMRRSNRNTYRVATSIFPLMILMCAALVAVIALAVFSPLTELLEGLSIG